MHIFRLEMDAAVDFDSKTALALNDWRKFFHFVKGGDHIDDYNGARIIAKNGCSFKMLLTCLWYGGKPWPKAQATTQKPSTAVNVLIL